MALVRRYEVTTERSVWSGLGYHLTDPGLMAWGLGQLLFGVLAWRSGVLPNWVAVIGILGGVAGLLTLAVYAESYTDLPTGLSM